MFSNPVIRFLVAAVLGALTGVSLCIAILPLALQMAGIGDNAALSYYLSRLMVHAALVMGAGGLAVARTRHPLAGAPVLALTGLALAVYLVGVGLTSAPKPLVVGGLAGLIYGMLGGLILGRILAAPAVDD